MRIRFIPATAGNGYQEAASQGLHPVHPRDCGERDRGVIRRVIEAGSSPRLRGTAPKHRKPALASRFIPATAGNGCRFGQSHGTGTVHPRDCGERWMFPFIRHELIGSSPRLRGTDRLRLHHR